MALITINAIIYITRIALMSSVGLSLGMTIGALENHVVVRIRVAGRAHTVSVPVSHWEPGMVEGCPRPCSCVVARRAGGRKNGWRRFMNWIRGAVVVCLVTTVAGRRKRGVVVIYVTTGAGHLNVEASQREDCRVVIKLPIGPEYSVMTQLTVRWETHLDVVNRSDRRVVIFKMAGDARRICAG